MARDVARRDRSVAHEIDRGVSEDRHDDDPTEHARAPEALGHRDRSARGDDRQAREHREDVPVLADVHEHVEGQGCQRPQREKRGAAAIAELDPPRLGGEQRRADEWDEEVQASPQKARELVAVAVDGDGTVPKDAVAIVDESALDSHGLEKSVEPAVGRRADHRGDQRGRKRRPYRREQPQRRQEDREIRPKADGDAPGRGGHDQPQSP